MAPQETLAELTALNTSFSKTLPGLQLVWDTVSSGNLKQCARKYYYHHVENWWEKRKSVHLIFGLIVHSASETYCKVRAKGESHDSGVRLAVRHCLEKAGERDQAAVCSDCGHVKRTDISDDEFARSIYPNACESCNSTNIAYEDDHFFLWLSDDKNKNRYTLIRTIVWYLDHYRESSEKTIILDDGSPAVEQWFRFELPLLTPDGTPYILTGHIDQLIEFAGSDWFKDIKSTKNTVNDSFFQKFSPDNQMSFYTAAGKIVFGKPLLGGIIDAAQVAINFTHFQRGLVQRTSGQITEWLKDMEYWLKQAEQYAKDEYWPMNDTACHNFGGCEFRDVCNKDPSARRQKLETLFKREVWDPLKERKEND